MDECTEVEGESHNQDDAESEKVETRYAAEMLQSGRQWRENSLRVGFETQQDCSWYSNVYSRDQKKALKEKKCALERWILRNLLHHEDHHDKE